MLLISIGRLIVRLQTTSSARTLLPTTHASINQVWILEQIIVLMLPVLVRCLPHHPLIVNALIVLHILYDTLLPGIQVSCRNSFFSHRLAPVSLAVLFVLVR